jgi:isoquinoline 1-oxidoreductase beta subunit
MSTSNNSITRRQFLKKSGNVALFIGASGLLPQLISCKNISEVKKQLKKQPLTAWLQMSEDGRMTIYNPAAEMGQGSMTSLPALFAEEMDADWSMVNVEFSPQESTIYGSDGWGNRKVMLSAGSRVTKGYYHIMRKAGAQARYMMMHTASKKWELPITEVTTDAGWVMNTRNDQRLSYGELVPFLEIPETLPDFTETDLKDPKAYRFVGKIVPRTDIPEKVNGKAQFAIDVRLPNMCYGVLERGTVHGAKPTLKNEAAILAMEGVEKVVPLEYAIGIIAKSLEQALAAKKQLEIEWSKAVATGFNSQKIFTDYEKMATRSKKGEVITELGNIDKALRTASKTYSSDFKNDYVYHAQMEPLNSVVQIAEDGQSAEAWVGSQQGFDSKLGIPGALGIKPENVKINLQYLGGGFGRRSMTDFVTECALLAKEVIPNPVKLIWTREDDVTYGAFRPLTLQRLKASTNASGAITGFYHCVVGDGGNLVASGIKNAYYDIPNQFAEWREVKHGIRLKHWRAVGHGPNKFAIECFIDEIARDQGMDPVEIRRKLMAKSPRALATLEKAVAMSKWNSTSADGRAKGIAFLERSGTLSTGVCEISLDRNTGVIKVHHFWTAMDAGIVIQPDNVKAQMEGGIVMGISSVLKEQITIEDGKVKQSNFHDYQLLRFQDIPESIEIEILESQESPQGVGESGTPLVACAIANAFLSLTGKQLRHLPFTPNRVLEVLNS